MKALRRQKYLLALLLVAFMLCLGTIALWEIAHYQQYGHFISYGLHSDVIVVDTDIGIPGVTKMYKATLLNFGLLPVKLQACDYVTDAFDKGTAYPYIVQRWDETSQGWQTLFEPPSAFSDFCRPVPLSWIEANTTTKRLLPGISIDIMEGEATGAKEAFQRGDKARFVIFRNLDKKDVWTSAIPTTPFVIEDHAERNGVRYRIAH